MSMLACSMLSDPWKCSLDLKEIRYDLAFTVKSVRCIYGCFKLGSTCGYHCTRGSTLQRYGFVVN